MAGLVAGAAPVHNGPMRALIALSGGLGAWALMTTLALGQVVGTPGQPVRLLFQERVPYTESLPDGSVRGLVATPAEQALKRAGIAFVWERTPSQRQLLLAQGGQVPACGLGWFRNPEREALGRFSRPLYHDQPMAALVPGDSAIPDGGRMQELIANPRFRLLTKEGFSYGAQIDAWLGAQAANRLSTGAEPPQLVLMLLGGRADWMPVAPEEAQALIGAHPPGALRLVRFVDVGPGLPRHLYCSRAVPGTVMEAIDRELARLPSAPPAR